MVKLWHVIYRPEGSSYWRSKWKHISLFTSWFTCNLSYIKSLKMNFNLNVKRFNQIEANLLTWFFSEWVGKKDMLFLRFFFVLHAFILSVLWWLLHCLGFEVFFVIIFKSCLVLIDFIKLLDVIPLLKKGLHEFRVIVGDLDMLCDIPLQLVPQINGWPIRTVSGHTRSVTLFWLKKYKTLSLWGPGWLKELGSCITLELVQTYHQYSIGSSPAL